MAQSPRLVFDASHPQVSDVVDAVDQDKKGHAIFTGQPGIDEHHYQYLTVTSNQRLITRLLYSILIPCIIHARPIVFQDMEGRTFSIDNTGVRLLKAPRRVWEDVDGESCEPNTYIFRDDRHHILLTSPPSSWKD